MRNKGTVFVVDDDGAVRQFLKELIESVDLRVRTYGSAQEFLEDPDVGPPGCILLDLRMPGMSGLELQERLRQQTLSLPIIFVTGHGNVQVAVHAMRAGAADFVEKPFNNELLIDRINKAVATSIAVEAAQLRSMDLQRRLELLTPRERQVLEIVTSGKTNKGVARDLGISEKTVELHRAKVMEKMQARSLAHLVRMMAALEID